MMRISWFLPVAFLTCVAASRAQSIEQKLKWVRETIDAHAVTQHLEPPAKTSSTKWQVTRIDGCTMELKETNHRESPDSLVTAGVLYGISEDKVSTWTFDLGNLHPQYIMADDNGGAHIGIFAQADTFHFKTEVVQRTTRSDGTVAATSTWSTPGAASNLWIYFDSPDGDNNQLIRKVEFALQSAVMQCVPQTHARR